MRMVTVPELNRPETSSVVLALLMARATPLHASPDRSLRATPGVRARAPTASRSASRVIALQIMAAAWLSGTICPRRLAAHSRVQRVWRRCATAFTALCCSCA